MGPGQETFRALHQHGDELLSDLDERKKTQRSKATKRRLR